MNSFRRTVPSPSMAIALIALFVALGGTAWAAATINGKNIKNGTITGKKLKNGTITGSKLKNRTVTASKIRNNSLGSGQINEASIAAAMPTVPSATRADSAGNVDGLAKFHVRQAAGTAEADVYNTGRLRITMECDGAGALTVRAYTSVDNASIAAYGNSADTNEDDFDIADNPITVSTADEERDLSYAEPGGQVVTAQFISAEQPDFSGGGCMFAGFYLAR